VLRSDGGPHGVMQRRQGKWWGEVDTGGQRRTVGDGRGWHQLCPMTQYSLIQGSGIRTRGSAQMKYLNYYTKDVRLRGQMTYGGCGSRKIHSAKQPIRKLYAQFFSRFS